MDAESIREYYEQDVGRYPDQVRIAVEEMPDAFSGYMEIRKYVLGGSDSPEDLPKRYVNLNFTLLDIASNNLEGAVNHARAALDSGLHWKELLQGLAQVWIVFGFASTWGRSGYQLVQALRDEGYGLAKG